MATKLVDVLESLNEALSSVSESDDMLRDVESHATDAAEAGDEARTANTNAQEMIDDAIISCKDAIKDAEGEVNPEEVHMFLVHCTTVIDESVEKLNSLRNSAYSNARNWGIELKGE